MDSQDYVLADQDLLDLPLSLIRVLNENNIHMVRDLVSLTENDLLVMTNMSKHFARKIAEDLAKYNLKLKP